MGFPSCKAISRLLVKNARTIYNGILLWNEEGNTGFYEASPEGNPEGRPSRGISRGAVGPEGNPEGWPPRGISQGTGLIKPSIARFIPQ